jgi:hypothetical protein
VCISQFILEDGGILDPTDDKSITWWDLNSLHRRCHSVHSVHSFSSQYEQYFSATSLLFFSEHGSQIVSMMDLQVEILWHWLFIKKKNLNIFKNKKNNIIILKYRLFKYIARLLFVQSDVSCALCICSGVAKGYRCEVQALEMNRKVGGHLELTRGVKACKNNT